MKQVLSLKSAWGEDVCDGEEGQESEASRGQKHLVLAATDVSKLRLQRSNMAAYYSEEGLQTHTHTHS